MIVIEIGIVWSHNLTNLLFIFVCCCCQVSCETWQLVWIQFSKFLTWTLTSLACLCCVGIMSFFPAASQALDRDDLIENRSVVTTSSPSVGELPDDLAIFERDVLVSFGAPLTFATLCARVGGRIQEERCFGNCSCKFHNWMLAGAEASMLGPWRPADPFTNKIIFKLECSGVLYTIVVLINRAGGSLKIVSVQACWDAGELPGLSLPVGDFVKARMEESLKRWDLANPGQTRGSFALDDGVSITSMEFSALPGIELSSSVDGMATMGEKAWFCSMMDGSSSGDETGSED